MKLFVKKGGLRLFMVVLSLALLFALGLLPVTPAVAANPQALSFLGITHLGGVNAGSGDVNGVNLEIREDPLADNPAPFTAPTTAPRPTHNAVTTNNPGFFGFNGLSHLDQRLAGTGAYANTQFSLEPPDQALCVGNGYVFESVNTALAVYKTGGQLVSGPTAINQFLQLAPEIDRVNIRYGDFTSDPKCYFDAPTKHWFFTVLQLDVDPATGAFTGPSHTEIAVSMTGDPTGGWYLYQIDTTDDGTHGTPSHAGCPCLGDQPLIGADKYGFYVSNNEFPEVGPGFNGAQLYAMSKTALESGALPPLVHLDNLNLAEGQAYTIQPATTPPYGEYATGNGGTEYFMSALDYTATLDNRVGVWAMTNTQSLNSSTPNVRLTSTLVTTETYGQPPNAKQKDGSRPLGSTLGEPANQLNGNDDRMNQVVYADGKLWGAVNTVVVSSNGSPNVGLAYFITKPGVSGGNATASLFRQGYVSVDKENVMFPSVGVNAAGQGAVTYTLVGPDYYPSAGYSLVNFSNTGSTVDAVHKAGAGAGPADGFTGYQAYGGNGIERWGDYSAAVADQDGSIWMAAEYIPGGPRTVLANWGTFITQIKPGDATASATKLYLNATVTEPNTSVGQQPKIVLTFGNRGSSTITVTKIDCFYDKNLLQLTGVNYVSHPLIPGQNDNANLSFKALKAGTTTGFCSISGTDSAGNTVYADSQTFTITIK